jgi:hypothetical protein
MTEDQPKRRFFSRRRAFKWFVYAIPLFVVMALMFARSATPSKDLNITISFVGYTNGSNGILLAAFAITNSSKRTVIRYEYCNREQGKTSASAVSQIHFVEAIPIAARNSIAGGGLEVVYVQAPINIVHWRAEFLFVPPGFHLHFSDWCARHKPGMLKSIIPVEWQFPNWEFFRSNWINP